MADSPINTSAKRRTGKRLSIDFTGASFFSSAAKKSSITADGDRTTNSPESMRNGNEKSLDNMTEESNLSMPNRLRTFMRSSPLKPLPVVPTSDETTEETADEKKPGRKKGRFKSLDIRRYKPKILQQLNNAGGFSLRSSPKKSVLTANSSPSSPLPTWKNLHKELPMRPSSTHGSFASLRGTSQSQFSPGPPSTSSITDIQPILPRLSEAEVKTLLSGEYKVNQLNARMEVKTSVRFRFTEKELLFSQGNGGTQFVEYDTWANIMVIDTGRLIDRHNAFQLQSENQGIRIYEASTPGDKLNIMSLVQYFTSTTTTSQSGADSDSEEMYDTLVDNVIIHPQDENVMILNQLQNTLLAPTSFVAIRKRQRHLITKVEIEIDNRDKEVMQITTHMDKLKENANALGEDLLFFEQQNIRHRQGVNVLSNQLTDMVGRASMLNGLIRNHREPDVSERFPEMLDQLDSKLALLRLRVQQKQRITVVMAISLLMFLVILVKLLM